MANLAYAAFATGRFHYYGYGEKWSVSAKVLALLLVADLSIEPMLIEIIN